MEKFITDRWGRKIRMVNQPEIIDYIKNNPGKTENEIMQNIYGYIRGASPSSNKKYADCLRRALYSGKIRREFINNRYRYFIAEGPLKSDLPALKLGDMVIVNSLYLSQYSPAKKFIGKPVTIIEPDPENTLPGYVNVNIPNNRDGGLNVPIEKCTLVKDNVSQKENRIFKHNLKNENMIKVKSVYTMITVEMPIVIGDVSLNAEVMIHCGGDINKCDWDIADYNDVTLKGVQVTNVKKLRDFYKEMGIDLDNIIQETIEKQLSKDTMAYLVDSNVKFQ